MAGGMEVQPRPRIRSVKQVNSLVQGLWVVMRLNKLESESIKRTKVSTGSLSQDKLELRSKRSRFDPSGGREEVWPAEVNGQSAWEC